MKQPWTIKREENSNGIEKTYIVGERYIAEVFDHSISKYPSSKQFDELHQGLHHEAIVNARLIAAAPNGLAFAHAALDCLKTLANGTTDEIDTMRRNLRGPASIIQQGQDFISKAQGKENPG